ncbi:MAG: YciI family protein [Caulobacterales bacterium]|nr:YciI family protein [Caulobacterales bacterium]
MSAPTVERHPGRCFLVTCRDDPARQSLRAEHLDGHLAHVEAHWERYVVAGPLRAPEETAMSGSMFLVLADDLADAQALMSGDPYIASDLYAAVDYQELTMSIGRYLGGKIWPSADAIRHLATGG